jgi:hypothetical protein
MSAQFPLFSQVVLVQDLPKYDLKRGSIATVVEYYPMSDPEEDGYSLEGLNVPDITLEVASSQIISIQQWQKEIEIIEKMHHLSIPKLLDLESYIEKLLNEETNDHVNIHQQ